MQADVHVYTYIYVVYVCMYVRMYVAMHICLYLTYFCIHENGCVYVCTYAFMYVCTFTRIGRTHVSANRKMDRLTNGQFVERWTDI